MMLRSTHAVSRRRYSALAVVLAFGLMGAAPNQEVDQQLTYEASVQRTEGGVPHIRAHDFASMGFGTGYAMAEDILCLLADDRFLTFSAQRSRFLGEGGGNLESDFFYQLFIDRGDAEDPVDPRQAAVFRGAAAGYNRYLRDTPVANRDATCGGEAFVREISEIDWRRVSRMDFFLPFVSGLITSAQPPAPLTAAAAKSTPPQALTAEQYREIQVAWNERIEPFQEQGSNGIGLGRDATVDGTGMLLANPHQGWDGTDRFYAFHQTLPGELNVVGANVIGRPQVGFGTTEKVAWTSTVSTADRFTFYQLILNPENPTQYIFDGVPMDMIQETVTVQVPDGNGGFEDRTHTFYSTHFGAFLIGGFFPWNNFVAFAVRPAGSTGAPWRDIDSLIDQYQATTVRDLKAVHDAGQFLPVNLIAADASGETVYADPGPIPHLTEAQIASCSPFGQVLGNSTFCQWGTDPDAAAPGIFGPSNLPSLFRTDYVTNSNDSFWLSNPAEPITGIDPALGSVDSERELRTRGGLSLVQKRIAGTDGQAGSKFTLEQLQGLMLGNDAYSGEILRDGIVALCQANPTVTLPDTTVVDVSPACPVLAAWDLHDNLDSKGAHLFREFMGAGDGGRTLPSSWNYVVPFSLADPVNTPSGLDPVTNPDALQALAQAVELLNDAGIALDAKLGDLQSEPRGADQIPIHGGTNASGLFNIIRASFQGAAGYPDVSSGSSWIQATEFTADGPVSRGILTYSQSPNPDSPHFADQTLLFSQKQWVDLPFTDAEVSAAAVSSADLSEGKADCKKDGWQAFTNPAFADQSACVEYYNALRIQRLDEIKARN
jgi:acyl-homoserine-lactone acylase